jgi:thiol-disulfide isomerase/thioredoxin
MITISRAILLFFIVNVSYAQKRSFIKGIFPQAINKEIIVKGYTMAGDSLLAKGVTDATGTFSIAYPTSYVGAATLEIKDTKRVILLLNHENFEMQWNDLEEFKTLKFKNSPENDAFANGVAIAQRAESILSGLNFLKPIYEQEAVSSPKKTQWISSEIDFQKRQFPEFLKALPNNSYSSYYLKARKLLQDMQITNSKFIERLSEHEQEFNSMDFKAKSLLHSGLYKELLEGYFTIMENNGDIENVYFHINNSVDLLLKSLEKNPELKQEVAEYLFRHFEKRSLNKAAEHLALAMLNNQSCTLDSKLEALFEQYRKMAMGRTTVDIVFKNTTKPLLTLNSIASKYKLVVFGASWCEKCQVDIPKLKSYYENWNSKYNLEIVFVSLDTEKEKYNGFVKDFPWTSSCELMGWESKAAIDYCVFGTPTMYLLDRKNTILLKPISEKQIQAWLEINANE